MRCVSFPSDLTSVHRSPIICSRRGSASNTAGNWLIHCLATIRTENMFTSRKQSGTTSSVSLSPPALSCCPYSPDQVAHLSPPRSSLVGGAILVCERESQGSEHTAAVRLNITTNTSRGRYFKSALPARRAKQSQDCFPDLIIKRGHVIRSRAPVGPERCPPSGRGGYRVRSFWANVWDGTTQLCIIRVMWTIWEPLGLQSFPSESARKTQHHTRRINVRQ